MLSVNSSTIGMLGNYPYYKLAALADLRQYQLLLRHGLRGGEYYVTGQITVEYTNNAISYLDSPLLLSFH